MECFGKPILDHSCRLVNDYWVYRGNFVIAGGF